MTTSKLIKIIRIAIEAAFLLTFLFLCIAVGVKNKHLKAYKQQLKAQTETIDSLKLRCDQLWAEDAITINVQCNIQQKGMVNLNQSNQIARSVSSITRGEVVAAMDSIAKANNKK